MLHVTCSPEGERICMLLQAESMAPSLHTLPFGTKCGSRPVVGVGDGVCPIIQHVWCPIIIGTW